MPILRRAWHFLRGGMVAAPPATYAQVVPIRAALVEKDGMFVHPHTPNGTFKTYMDVLAYPEGDVPASTQGFQTGPDPVEAAIDAKLGVLRDNGVLRLEPSKASHGR